MNPTRKVWYDKNNVPPTNYIWYKSGKYLENIDGKWVESGGMNNSGSGIKPDMTEAEQMQARKDLGLYYEETTTGEKTVVSDGVQDSKLSDDAPSKDSIVNVLNPENESVEYTITDIENGYQIKTQLEDGNKAVFYVITDGDSKGIFDSGAFYGMGYKLVYNGPITTISKVPEKFLPEQESGMPTPAVLLSVPTSVANSISGIISDEDYQRLVNLETNVAVYNEESSYLVAVKKWSEQTNQYVDLIFYGKDGVEILIRYTDTTFNRYTWVYPIRRSIVGEITDGMTAEQLAEIGVDMTLLRSVMLGYVNFVQYGNGFGGIHVMYSQEDPSDYSVKYVFADLVNTYTINVDSFGAITGATVVAR